MRVEKDELKSHQQAYEKAITELADVEAKLQDRQDKLRQADFDLLQRLAAL